MASFNLIALSTTSRTLNSNELGFVGRNGALVTTSFAVTMNNNSDLVVEGAIVSTSSSVRIADNGYVSITQHGNVTSTGIGTYGIDIGGSHGIREVINAGVISGQRDGIGWGGISSDPDPSALKLVNTGAIIGQNRAGVTTYSEGGAASDIQNAGTIHGNSNGIWVLVSQGSLSTRIVNSGEITATETGIFGSVLAEIIQNSGLIATASPDTSGLAMELLGGDDRVVNSGTILGDADLGDGADTYRGGRGEIVGDVLGGNGDDRLLGGAGGEAFKGGGGNDTLKGRGGEDDLEGGGGDDDMRGGAHDDTLLGGGGADKMQGGRDDDLLIGGGGGDVLNGGKGDDILIGGTGGAGDRFVFKRKAGDDQISDFENGSDLINLTNFGIRAGDYASVVAPALSNAGNNTTFLDLEALGGEGSVLIKGLKFSQADASDFLL